MLTGARAKDTSGDYFDPSPVHGIEDTFKEK